MTMREPGRDWAAYYAKTAGRPPRETLLTALDRFAAEGKTDGFAVDLGCGIGRDAVELLRRGWRVLGIDAEAAALDGLRARPDLPEGAPLETLRARFETATWPAADLVNSSFALPFVPPEAFGPLWRKIVASLRPGGRFAGHLVGDRDSWARRPDVTCHARHALDALLAGLEVELLREEEDDGVTPRGEAKHWHIWHVVARRPPPPRA